MSGGSRTYAHTYIFCMKQEMRSFSISIPARTSAGADLYA